MTLTATPVPSSSALHWLKLALATLFVVFAAVFISSFLNAQSASADEPPPGISLEQGNGSTFTIGQPQPNSGGGGGVGGGPGGGTANPLYRSLFGKCATVSASNVCTTVPVVRTEVLTYASYQVCPAWVLTKNGTRVATGGPAAQRYLIAEAAPLWNNFNDPETLANRLSNREWDPSNPASPTWDPLLPFKMPTYAQLPFSFNVTMVQGPYRFYQPPCTTAYAIDSHVNTSRATVCPPTTRNSYYPAAVGVVSYQYNSDNRRIGPYTNKAWNETSFSCVYVKVSTPPQPEPWYQVTCYHTVTYSLWTSESRASIQTGGTQVGGTYRAPNPTPAYLSNGDKVLNNCTTSFNNAWNTNLAQYGYYRIQGDHLGTTYQVYKWPAWTGNPNIPLIRQLGTANYAARDYYTYSCSTTPPVVKAPNYAGLPAQGTRAFSESQCPQVTWSCQVNGTVDIAGTHAAATVMRDGKNVQVRLPGIAVSGNGVRDVTNGASTVQDSNMDYRLTVANGVSPISPSSTDPNFAQQYFKLWKANGTTNEKFGTWFASPNANRDKFLSWIWSSDVGKTWSMSWQARFDAQFFVPVSTGVGPGGGTGTSNQWVTEENIQCPTSADRTSNLVTVVRSVNNG